MESTELDQVMPQSAQRQSFDALGLDPIHFEAYRTGLLDGFEQGFELSMGMSYDDLVFQWAYDTGTYLGACLQHHPRRDGSVHV